MTDGMDPLDFAALTVAHDESNAYDAVVPPIVQTSLFTFPSYDDMVASYRGEKVRPIYTRGLNPTVRAFEECWRSLRAAKMRWGLPAVWPQFHQAYWPSSIRVIALLRCAMSTRMRSGFSVPS
jgi:hypothetical protein